MEKLLSIIVVCQASIIIFFIFKFIKTKRQVSDARHRLNVFNCMSKNEPFQIICRYFSKIYSANNLYFYPISKREDINRYFSEKIKSPNDLKYHLEIIKNSFNSKKIKGLRLDIVAYLEGKSNLILGNWYAETVINEYDCEISDFIFGIITNHTSRQAKDMQEFMDTVIFVLNKYKKDKNVNEEKEIDKKIQEFKINIANSCYPVSLK